MADESFAALMEQNRSGGGRGRRLRAGEVIEAKVIQISGDAVFVDVGTPSDGKLARSEFEDKDGNVSIRVGQVLKATVMDPRPDGPVLSVSLGRRGSGVDLSALELAKTSGVAVVGKVERAVKGGLEVSLGGVPAFCPASQVEIGYAAELEGYVGRELEFKVLEIREGGRSVVVSRRSLLEDKRREAASELLEKLVPGAELEGTVTSFNKHGAVIDLGGLDGFVHISELGRRVQRPEDALELGERVTARLISVEDGPKGPRIKLSLKSHDAPEAAPAAAPDEVLKAQVIAATSGGVTVNTPKGEGFVPMRELGLPQGADHRRAFPPGRELDVVVLSQAGGRLRLSATQVARVEERRNFRDYSGGGGAAPGAPAAGFGSLGDVLRKQLGLPATAQLPNEEPKSAAPAPARAAGAPAAPPKQNDAVIRRKR